MKSLSASIHIATMRTTMLGRRNTGTRRNSTVSESFACVSEEVTVRMWIIRREEGIDEGRGGTMVEKEVLFIYT